MSASASKLLGLLAIVVGVSCAESSTDDRRALVVATLARADEVFIRTRPQLSSGKYQRMAADLYGFYRGTIALYARDARDGGSDLARSRYALDRPVLGIGDPHPENFGLLYATDGTATLEPNDFDSADRTPYLRDLRRLTIGMVIAAFVSNADDPVAAGKAIAAARTIARATAAGYADAIVALADGAPKTPISDGGGIPPLVDLFQRGTRDRASRAELGTLTVLSTGSRRLVRGAPDATDPAQRYDDLPTRALDALPATLARYRDSLLDPPPPEYFTLLDATRAFGSGVASYAKVRALILVRGPTDSPDDDVILELKELSDSNAAAPAPPGVWFDDVPSRILSTSRNAWARPDADPLWGVSKWLGFEVQLKTESEANKTLRTKRMVGARGTPEALVALGARLGALLARVHGTDVLDARAIAERIRAERDAFADEQAEVSVAYADQVRADYARFQDALATIGPRLGVPCDPADAPSPDLAALYGTTARPFCP